MISCSGYIYISKVHGSLTVLYESVLVPHSSLKCNSKFPVGMSKFPVQTRNFQLDKVEISSSNSKFPVGMSKFPV